MISLKTADICISDRVHFLNVLAELEFPMKYVLLDIGICFV